MLTFNMQNQIESFGGYFDSVARLVM